MAAECVQIDLYKFLTESELQQYYNAIKNELKISNPAHLKYATDEDLTNIGLSRPEIRRLRKFHEKYFPHGYLSKIKRLLQAPATIVKREDVNSTQSLSANSHASGESASNGNSANASGSPSKVPNNKHIIPADSISVNKQLGTGEFGIVQQGVWTNGTERIQVAIKCLCRERMQSNPMEFLKEAAIMHSIEHENIVRLYGVVLATDSLMLVTELAHLRSLLECLKDSGLRTSFLTVPTLCEFAQQICNGMRYLESKRLIHRDLAARNILVFSKSKVKISDFGLSRALGVGKDYYKTNFNVNLKLPIAWCAPECINYLRFTNASDVWAYGVCLWEMFSYGFQPWAALTGLQILEAIDAPNYQRLEQPECCPSDYYTLMIKCWQDDPAKRPKFSEICELLPEMKPEQLKAAANCLEAKKDHLLYRQGDIITVLDRNTGTPFWKGVLMSGKTGFFNPSNTVAYVEGLPSSNRDSFCRVNERNSTRRKLRTEMISKPQNDLKHTGHVGIDGASFGDIAFLGNSQNYNHVPRQIVTPYKPSEDIEQTPLLLPPTPTSPDSLQTASGYFPDGTSLNPTFVPSTENTPKHFGQTNQAAFEFPGLNASTNPFAKQQFNDDSTFAMQNNNYGIDTEKLPKQSSAAGWSHSIDDMHEYHEISDDEMTADKLDFGPSLLDEINSVFGSMSAGSNHSQPKTPDFEQTTNIKNEFVETTPTTTTITTTSNKKERKQNVASGGTSLSNDSSNGNSKFSVSLSRKKTAPGTVKPISVKDEKILNQAIDFANEISARSMVDLVSDQLPTTQSPKRKFSFRFPHLNGNNGSGNGNTHDKNGRSTGIEETTSGHRFGITSPHTKKKNFTEELRSIPDLQTIIGEEGREAYNSLIERKTAAISPVNVAISPAVELLRELETSRTLPRRSSTFSQQQSDTDNGNGNVNSSENNGHKIDRIAISLATPPPQNAPRPMTLPTRGAASRMRNRVLELNGTCRNSSSILDDDNCSNNSQENCESPSYLVNTNSTFYKFPNDLENHNPDRNPVPLPPRDGKKHIKTNAKRHVRKHPLIIPANGVQRTLNKVTERTPGEDDSKWPTQNNNNTNNNNSTACNLQRSVTHEIVATVRPSSAMAMTAEKTSDDDDAIYQNGSIEKQVKASRHNNAKTDPTYMNLEKDDSKGSNGDNDDATALNNNASATDTASMQFESILEGDCDKSLVLQSPDVTDGFYNFSIQKENYNKSKGVVEFDPAKISKLYANEDELRNLDIEQSVRHLPMTGTKKNLEIQTIQRKKNEKLITTTPHPQPHPTASVSDGKSIIASIENNELAGNALFRKVRQTVEQSIIKTESSQGKSSTEISNDSIIAGTADAEKQPIERKQQTQTEAEYFAARAARLADSNSVSCEDLLEFADQKPKGRERGPDSDEVRIMTKVLGNQCNTARCLAALESTDWDVHKAIKLLKLQNILPACELSLDEAGEALQQYEWDLHTTALKLRGVKT